MLMNTKDVRPASLALSGLLSGSLWLILALSGSLWLAVRLSLARSLARSLALSGSLWLYLARCPALSGSFWLAIHSKSKQIGGGLILGIENWRKKCVCRDYNILGQKSVNHDIVMNLVIK